MRGDKRVMRCLPLDSFGRADATNRATTMLRSISVTKAVLGTL